MLIGCVSYPSTLISMAIPAREPLWHATKWIDHFENVAAVNDWNGEAKLLWLKARLAGRAHTAFKRFTVTTYSGAVEVVLYPDPPIRKHYRIMYNTT